MVKDNCKTLLLIHKIDHYLGEDFVEKNKSLYYRNKQIFLICLQIQSWHVVGYNKLMKEQYQQAQESPAEINLPLPVYESSHYMSYRNANLNELIKLHRNRQKYQIVDRFFNNSYISIENKLQPIEVYYQYETFKSYIDDLALVYFKDIELNENIRLEFVLRRLNFTLNGQDYDFKQFLEHNFVYKDFEDLFSEEYLEELTNKNNDKSVLNLRNSLMLSLIIDTIYSYDFAEQQRQKILDSIANLYNQILQKVHEPQIYTQSNQSIPQDSVEEYVKSQQCEFVSEHQKSANYSLNIDEFTAERYSFSFDDMIYQEQIDLKVIETNLEIQYFTNQLSDPQVDQTSKLKYRYIIQILKQTIEKLGQLRDLNIKNRDIIKKIQRNIKIQLTTGVKCICFEDSSDVKQCFGSPRRFDSVFQQKQQKFQKILDVQYMESQLLKMIKNLKLKLVADAIQKVYDIQKEDNRKPNELLFSVHFEHGIGIKQATLYQSDFLRLNQIREQSTLTSYLTPMKSTYSYISHNIYTFIKLMQKDFPYSKDTNNNQQVLKNIRSKIGKTKNFTKNDKKQFYEDQFKLCHNCKILCHQDFLKQCKKRAKQIKQQDSDCSDDSLYTQKNFRRKNLSPYFIECQKYYCLYCIRYQFNGKIFNDKGWCPACINNCHCNTCLREKIMKKYVQLYLYIGGDSQNIKTQMQMVNQMRFKKTNDDKYEDSSLNGTEIQEKAYENVIKKQIMKGYSADQIGQSLRHQEQLIQMIIKREQVKLRHHSIQKALFRQKISIINEFFDYQSIDRENENHKVKIEAQKQRHKQETRLSIKKRKQKKIMEKDSVKRKTRKVRRDEEIYYDFYRYNDDDSDIQSSSFHLRQKRQREKIYEPQYTF